MRFFLTLPRYGLLNTIRVKINDFCGDGTLAAGPSERDGFSQGPENDGVEI